MLKLQMCKFVLATGIYYLKIPLLDVPLLLWVQQFCLVRLNFQRVLLPVMVGEPPTCLLEAFQALPSYHTNTG